MGNTPAVVAFVIMIIMTDVISIIIIHILVGFFLTLRRWGELGAETEAG